MQNIKSPQIMFVITVLAISAFILLALRPESAAQSSSTFGGRYQLVIPKEDRVVLFIFDTASARTWQYEPTTGNRDLAAQSWREISPSFATK
jgi:hypothetical protein